MSRASSKMSTKGQLVVPASIREKEQGRILSGLPFRIEIVSVAAESAVRATERRVDRKVSYADAFALELALASPAPILVTADYGFRAVADLVQIDFLRAK